METFVIIAQQCLVVHRGVYLGSANVQTQYFSSDLQRLCMEDLSYHPKTCLEEKRQKKRTDYHATLANSPKTDLKLLTEKDFSLICYILQ